MSLIIREIVVTECIDLAREVETAVRNSTTNLLDDDVIEKICETHVKKIIEDAEKQIEKQVEEHEYQREDRYKLKQSAEMYNEKKSEITEVVNVQIIRREHTPSNYAFNDDNDNPETDDNTTSNVAFHQTNRYLHSYWNRHDKLLSDLDPENAICVEEIEPVANIDDANYDDLLTYSPHNQFWKRYQKTCEIRVDPPYHHFYDCNQKIIKLLNTHCKTKAEVVKVLGILSAHHDYSGVINIGLLYQLAEFMFNFTDEGSTNHSDEKDGDISYIKKDLETEDVEHLETENHIDQYGSFCDQIQQLTTDRIILEEIGTTEDSDAEESEDEESDDTEECLYPQEDKYYKTLKNSTGNPKKRKYED